MWIDLIKEFNRSVNATKYETEYTYNDKNRPHNFVPLDTPMPNYMEL